MLCPSSSWFCEYGWTLIFLLVFPLLAVAIFNAIVEVYKKIKQPELPFLLTPNHRHLHILNATAEQVIIYIKSIISAYSPYFNKDNKMVYYAVYDRTKFYKQQKDDTRIYGVVFAGLKYDLEFTEDGNMLQKKNKQKIPQLFSLSILPIGIGSNTKLRVNYET